MTHIVSTKRLSSGKYIDLSSLKPDDVDINDITTSLNYIYRFTGHWKDNPPLTVAQHTWLVHNLCLQLFPDDLETELDCIVHDFAESYTGDVATPLKRLFGPAFKDYEGEIEDVIYSKFYDPVVGHSLTKETYEKRKICDLLALDIERRAMWFDHKGKNHWPDIPMESAFKVKEKYDLYTQARGQGFVHIQVLYSDAKSKFRNYNNDFNI